MSITLELRKGSVEVDVDCDGDYLEARVYDPITDCWYVCNEDVMKMDHWQKEIAIAYEDYKEALKERDWTGEEELETA